MSEISRLKNKTFETIGLNEWGEREIIPNDFNSEIIETNQEFQNWTIPQSKIKNLFVDTITVSTSGYIKGGQTAYNTWDWFWLGYDSWAYKFSIGNANNYLTYDWTQIELYSNLSNAITLDYGSNMLLKEGGDVKFSSVAAPGACTAALVTTATGNLNNLAYTYKITFVTSSGETNLGTISNTVTVDASHKQVSLSNIPISTSIAVTARKIYRVKWVLGTNTGYHLLTTINNNITTTYTDNTADADLTGSSADNKQNDSFGKIKVDDDEIFSITSNSTYPNSFIGYKAGENNVTGYSNIFIGGYAGQDNTVGISNTFIGNFAGGDNISGNNNTSIGYNSFIKNTEGIGNVVIGSFALDANTTGDYNVAVGYCAGGSNETGDKNIFLGNCAGTYETGSDAFYVNNRDRSNTAGDKAKSILYGVMGANASDQKLTINGLLNQSVSKTPANAGASWTAGDICWDANYIYVCTATNTWKRAGIATW
jgi:hypothetical protein